MRYVIEVFNGLLGAGGSTVRVDSQKILFLLLIGTDVDEGGRPFGVIYIFQFLQQNLNFLPIGRVLSDQM